MDPIAALSLLGFAFVSSVTPGPNNLMVMASGANFGYARTVIHMAGITIGFAVMIVLVGLGLVQQAEFGNDREAELVYLRKMLLPSIFRDA